MRYVTMILGLTAVLLFCSFSATALTIKDAEIGVYTAQTELVIELDKPAEFSIEADVENKRLYLSVDAKLGKKVVAPAIDGLITSVEFEPSSNKTRISIGMSEGSGSYRGYATQNPATIVLQVFRIHNVKPPIPQSLTDLRTKLSSKTILLIDDDDGPSNKNKYGVDVDGYYKKPLEKLELKYDIKAVRTGSSGPSYSDISGYPIVIWFTGLDARPVVLSNADMSNLRKYVANGGRLIIVSQNLISDGGSSGRRFCSDLVGAGSYKKDTQIESLFGSDGGPFNEDVWQLDLTQSIRPIGNWGDGFECNDSATPFFSGDDGYHYAAGSNYENGKAVLYSFAIENLAFDRVIAGVFLKTLVWITEDMED